MDKMPLTSITSGMGLEVVPDVYCFSIQIVNVVFIGNPKETNEFVLIDAGMPGSEEVIIAEAVKRFGENCRPSGVVLTHGHFDHVGALQELIKKWDVPVYAHHLEQPYLNGKSDYPPPNPKADGLVAKMSPLFPRHSIDISSHLKILNGYGNIPCLPNWRYLHTPGHTPGHISLFRDSDQVFIAGDAITTVEQESLYDVITQKQELHGPPAYFTLDWEAAEQSVKKIEALHPEAAITGHGLPMTGKELQSNLKILVDNFRETEVPENIN